MRISGIIRRIIYSGLMVSMIMALLLGTVGNALALNTLTWTTKAPMSTPRVAPGVVAASNGKIYAIGGSDSPFLNSVEEYNPSSDTWVDKAPMPTARHSFGCAQATNGRIYAMGGWNGWFLSNNEEYDPATDTWTTKAPLWTAMHNVSVVAADNGLVYAIGGTNTYGVYHGLTRVDAYNPADNTWTTVAPMPTGRWAAAGVLASDGNIYVIGGRAETATYTTPFNTVEAYNPATDTWTTKAPLPTGRSSLAAIATGDGKIYAMGGTEDGNNMTDRVDVYDLATDTWSSETPMPTARGALGAAYINGTIYAIGGYPVTNVVEAAVPEAPINTYTLTYTAGANGSITGTSPQTVDYGANGAEVTAVADVGYHFVSWSDGILTASRTDNNVTGDITVTANFAINTYTIQANAGTGGSISPSGAVTVDEGANQAFNINPDPGYQINDVLVDGSSVGAVASYTFTDVTDNHTIAASFAVENQPPRIQSLTADPSQLWPPNKKPVNVKITVAATDPDGAADIVRTTYSVADEYGYNVAETNLPSNGVIALIADRAGNDKDGRVYAITIKVYDAGELSATGSVNVIVPHDQGK